MTLDWATGFLLAGAAQGVALAVLLLCLRSGRPADRWFAATLVVLAGMTTPYVFGWRGHREAPDWLAFLPANVPLALAPALYGSIFSRVEGRSPPGGWRHFVPAMLESGYLAACSLLPAEWRHGWKEDPHDHWAKPLIEFAVLVSLFVYGWLAAGLLTRTRSRLRQERSDVDRYALGLVSALVAVLFATAAALTAIRIYANFIAEIDIGPFFLWLAFVSMLLSAEGWRGTALPAVVPADPATMPDRKSHDWSALGAKWRDRLDVEGWWREPDLKLTDVARRLGVNASYVSRAFNEGLGSNFNELVNASRAREVARGLEEGRIRDLTAAALDAGFSSKATFNRAFQATFGMTPTAYRKRLKD